jgi:hypothetical protein
MGPRPPRGARAPPGRRADLPHARGRRDAHPREPTRRAVVARRARDFFDEFVAAEEADRPKVLDRVAALLDVVDGGERLDEIRVLLMPRIRPRRYFVIDVPMSIGARKGGLDPDATRTPPSGSCCRRSSKASRSTEIRSSSCRAPSGS